MDPELAAEAESYVNDSPARRAYFDQLNLAPRDVDGYLDELDSLRALVDHYHAALVDIARPTTGYQVWQASAARKALESAPTKIKIKNNNEGRN